MIYIYTDGSHLNKLNNGRLGCGGVMINGNDQILKEFSKELDKNWLVKTLGTDKVSNPTAEMLGALIALKEFDIPSNEQVTLFSDYTGVMASINGTWKIKDTYMRIIKEEIDKVLDQKNLRGRIKFEWVKGHQSGYSRDAKWNNYVDKLAKGQ